MFIQWYRYSWYWILLTLGCVFAFFCGSAEFTAFLCLFTLTFILFRMQLICLTINELEFYFSSVTQCHIIFRDLRTETIVYPCHDGDVGCLPRYIYLKITTLLFMCSYNKLSVFVNWIGKSLVACLHLTAGPSKVNYWRLGIWFFALLFSCWHL
jgi:hypothetical protein